VKDILGKALLHHHLGQQHVCLGLNNSYGPQEQYEVEVFFATGHTDLEEYALSLCKGKVLDIGAAAGRHSLYLQGRGLEVSALEISPGCCRVMRERGVLSVLEADLFDTDALRAKFDTLLLLMNGLGLAGTLAGLPMFFATLDRLLAANGQVLLDSSNIDYLFTGSTMPSDHYFGEVEYQWEYSGQKGPWFHWLYLDIDRLYLEAKNRGWRCQVLFDNDSGGYLARLTKK
jgi:SAM-dependent methyltransferase